MSKVSSAQQAAWSEIVTKKYSDQAIWFMNGFWSEVEASAENIWKWVELFSELDQDKKGDGCELDEFWSHKFLESLGETMTVIEMREKFRTIDVDFNKRMSLIEFLSYHFKKSIQDVIDAPQGDNQEEIEAAQAAVAAAQKAVDEMVERLNEATRTADEADAAAAEAKAASDAAEAAAAPYRAAVAENEKALEELHAQEKAYEDKKAALEKTKNDMSIGVVKRNKAANELDQLLGEDPLPLRKAKINQEATVRKMEKAAKPFNEASAKAKAAKEVAMPRPRLLLKPRLSPKPLWLRLRACFRLPWTSSKKPIRRVVLLTVPSGGWNVPSKRRRSTCLATRVPVSEATDPFLPTSMGIH